METKESNIYWDDLKPEVQEGIAQDRNTTPEEFCKEGNFDVVPIAIVMI